MPDPITITRFEVEDRPVCAFRVDAEVIFDLDAELIVDRSGTEPQHLHLGAAGIDVCWLPAGEYRLDCPVHADRAAGTAIELILRARAPEGMIEAGRAHAEVNAGSSIAGGWKLSSQPGTPQVERLSWARKDNNWFFRHFDHATRSLIHLLFDDHPSLRGEILDVGCGDGLIDLGVALRKRPRRLVGVDPFRGYERLAEICRAHFLPESVLACPGLEFRPDDGNALGFDDDSFDVVLSWGSLEHIAGGYGRTLNEIRRVLRPGGLFFVHPGLYYGSGGNHLGEFFDDPWIHLKLEREDLRERVLSGTPRYMDRAGEKSPPEQYWRWFEELNPITVDNFEDEMRALDFEPWRFALRSDSVVEYTPELQRYPMTTLGLSELYAVFVNRKSEG